MERSMAKNRPEGVDLEKYVVRKSVEEYDLGYFDEETNRVEPGENPFGSKVLPMSSV